MFYYNNFEIYKNCDMHYAYIILLENQNYLTFIKFLKILYNWQFYVLIKLILILIQTCWEHCIVGNKHCEMKGNGGEQTKNQCLEKLSLQVWDTAIYADSTGARIERSYPCGSGHPSLQHCAWVPVTNRERKGLWLQCCPLTGEMLEWS